MEENIELFETITRLREDFEQAYNINRKPIFDKVDENYVFDEEKSVRWNREKAQERNKLYDELCVSLEENRQKQMQNVYDRIYNYIRQNVGCSQSQAETIWWYVYGEYHSNGYELFEKLDDFIGLFSDYETNI